ncbi:hypothetical protein Tco_0902555 [Tanacetum coccineum]
MSNDPLSQEIGSGNTPGSDEERLEQDDLTDFVPPTTYDSPLSRGHTPGSDEGRPNINELMAIYTNLSNRVLALEQSKTAQDLVIQKLKKKVKRLEKKQRARTLGMKLYKIGISKRKSLDQEYVSKQGRKSDKTKPMFDDSDFAELDVDNAMDNVKGDAKTHGRNTAKQITTTGDIVNTASIDVSAAGPSNVSTADPSTKQTKKVNSSTTCRLLSIDKGKALMVETEKPPKNPRKAQIQMDEELAIRLHKEEKANLERMQRERVVQKEASNAALIVEFDNVQTRMETYALLPARLQEKEREKFSIDEQARFLVETIAERKSYMKRSRSGLRILFLWILKKVERKQQAVRRGQETESDEESVTNDKRLEKLIGSGEGHSAEKEKELLVEDTTNIICVVPVKKKKG